MRKSTSLIDFLDTMLRTKIIVGTLGEAAKKVATRRDVCQVFYYNNYSTDFSLTNFQYPQFCKHFLNPVFSFWKVKDILGYRIYWLQSSTNTNKQEKLILYILTVQVKRCSSTYLCDPNQFVLPPQSNILIMTSCGKDFIVWMNCQAPQLSTMTKNNLPEIHY